MKRVRCAAKRTTYTTHGIPGAECPHDAKRGQRFCGKHQNQRIRDAEKAARQLVEQRLAWLDSASGDFGRRDTLLAEVARAVRESLPDRAEQILRELEQRLLP